METKSTTTTLRQVVKEAFEDILGRPLHDNEWDDERRTLAIDSLEHLTMIMNVEKALGIKINDELSEDLTSPNKVLKYLESL